MNTFKKALAAFSGTAAVMLGVTPAFAAGTAANTNIDNTATVNFSVGGTAQPVVSSNLDRIKVDRKINLLVQEEGAAAATTVAMGENGKVTTFRVTNQSNAPLDFALAVSQQTGGAGPRGTDAFDMLAPSVFVDSNGNGTYDAGTDTATFMDEIAADDFRIVFVVANTPATGLTNGTYAAVGLTATAREAGTVGTQGVALVETTGANVAGTVDTVFADGIGTVTGDGNRDAKHSAKDDFVVSVATLSAVKSSRVTTDPFNLTVNPKAIPGATVEYCIAVTNATGGSTATAVEVSDSIPTNTTYVAGSARQGATVTAGVCSGGSATGTSTTGSPVTSVTGTIGTMNAGTTSGVYFQVTVN
jgi:uncharacterized repeat protein (TIGR01451 family)